MNISQKYIILYFEAEEHQKSPIANRVMFVLVLLIFCCAIILIARWLIFLFIFVFLEIENLFFFGKTSKTHEKGQKVCKF